MIPITQLKVVKADLFNLVIHGIFNQTFTCHIGNARAVCAVPSFLKVLDQTIIFLGFKS